MGENNPKNAQVNTPARTRAAIQARMDAHVIGRRTRRQIPRSHERMRAEGATDHEIDTTLHEEKTARQ